MTNESIKSALESILFVWGDPLEAKTAAELFNLPVSDMLHILRELADDYESRRSGLRIREADKAFQLCTNPENDDYITKLVTPIKEKRLSQAAWFLKNTEKREQPVTKAQIDAVRGIKSDRVLETLMKKDLVEEKGRSSSIGRPILYGTTRNFLFTFGFESLDDLPELEDVGSLVLDDDLEGLELPRGLADPDQLTLPIEEQ